MLKLEEARVLLEHTFWKVERIRIEVGYCDHSHFFRDFKAHFGVTPSPSQYRARHIDARLSTKSVADKKIVKSATKK
jgi:AraC-like DNA-binding protein